MDTLHDLPPLERMKKAIREYFKGEKSGGFILLIWSVLATVVAWFLNEKCDGVLFKGLAPPLFVLAILQLIVGATILLRTEKQRGNLLSQLIEFPKLMRVEEAARMEKVMANFEKIKVAELLLLLLGIGFLIGGVFFGLGEYMVGTGIGLCIQCAFSLVFDLFASMRAGFYVHELKAFERDF